MDGQSQYGRGLECEFVCACTRARVCIRVKYCNNEWFLSTSIGSLHLIDIKYGLLLLLLFIVILQRIDFTAVVLYLSIFTVQ